ncbi:DUF3189 family protein [Paenibacillus sp. NPDC056579]|uniref:DUF3189 family protein n=1 Tax=Paenibacillus sp. NPDC056579 TaxID=3345871 RepID=UPI0036CA660E
MTIGGMFSEALKIDFIRVPLLVLGAKQTYQNIINLVDHTRNAARNASSPLTSLQNKE